MNLAKPNEAQVDMEVQENKVSRFRKIAHDIAPRVEEALSNLQDACEHDGKDVVEVIVHDDCNALEWYEYEHKNKYGYRGYIKDLLLNLTEAGMCGVLQTYGDGDAETLAEDMADLYKRKNSDYGNSFERSVDRFGLVVSVIRIGDKVHRLQRLTQHKAEVTEESIADTFVDLACYAIMTLMWMEDNEKKS